MKIILNQDVIGLGEEGDIKEVANGYARNYLLPRKLAWPYNKHTLELLEQRRTTIETRKGHGYQRAAGKRRDRIYHARR